MPAEKQQLDQLLAKFTPDIAAAGKAAIKKMRQRLPGALELVYDNYNAPGGRRTSVLGLNRLD